MANFIKVNGRDVHIKGWRPDKPDHRDLKMVADASVALPKNVDLSPGCGPILDQGQLGSCTANSSTSAMEFLEKKAGKDIKIYSRLFLYYTERVKLENTPATSDSGAQIRDTLKALGYFGTCYETTWPYDTSRFSVDPSGPAWVEASKHRITGYWSLPALHDIKYVMATLGLPVIGGFSVPANMESAECAQTGVVKYPAPDEDIVGGHAILFVGYDDDKQLIKFQNSWSDQWGDKGFGYLPYQFFTDGLADDFWVIKTEQF